MPDNEGTQPTRDQVLADLNELDDRALKAALLAGLTQAPSVDDPFTAPGRALARRREVLAAMLDTRVITPRIYRKAVSSKVVLHPGRLYDRVREPYFFGFVRDQLTKWEKANGHTVRLKAYSSHYNITYETPKRHQTRARNEKALALLLTYILPVPVMLVASNRRSTVALWWMADAAQAGC